MPGKTLSVGWTFLSNEGWQTVVLVSRLANSFHLGGEHGLCSRIRENSDAVGHHHQVLYELIQRLEEARTRAGHKIVAEVLRTLKTLRILTNPATNPRFVSHDNRTLTRSG